MKKIAIIGSGFFGIASAIILSKKNNVHIYEKKNTILCGASRANQMRFHKGYHYPRSIKTVKEINQYNKDFEKYFKSVIYKTKNYYGISKKKSKTSFKKYLSFLTKNKLKYKFEGRKYFSNNIEGVIKSKEKILNYFHAKNVIIKKLKTNKKIKIFLRKKFEKINIKNYDQIIICTYDQNNDVLSKLGIKPKRKFKFELIEKIIVKLPNKYKNKSFMVLDGKFVCVDPYLGTNYHLLSDNLNSKLEITKSLYPNFKDKRRMYINRAPFYCLKQSNFKKFVMNGKKFLPFLEESKYIKSFFVTRAVDLGKEKTDERLSKVERLNNKVYTVFSGKWNTCIGVAKKLEKILSN
jgi:hypothetical protein